MKAKKDDYCDLKFGTDLIGKVADEEKRNPGKSMNLSSLRGNIYQHGNSGVREIWVANSQFLFKDKKK